jgi:hypothetical protein
MNTPDEDTVSKAMEDVRRILVEYIAGTARRHANGARLLAVIDQVEVGRALDRVKQRRTMRLME